MIIVLSEELDYPLTHTRIGWHRYTNGTVSASSNTGDSDRTGPLRSDTVDYWEPASLSATWTITYPQAVSADYVAIHGTFAGVSVKIEYEDDGWQALKEVVSPDNRPIAVLFDEVLSNQWRITFAGSGDPVLRVVNIGKVMTMPRSVYGGITPPNLSRSTDIYQNVSHGGQLFGQKIIRGMVTGGISFQNIRAQWMRETFQPFVRHARNHPYFLMWRPSSFPNEIVYVSTGDDIRPSNMGRRDLMQVSWNFAGPGHD